MDKQELLDMKLHEVRNVPCKSHDIEVRRVVGGWLYTTIFWDNKTDMGISSSMCFVPEVINIEAYITDVTNRTHKY